MSGIQYPSADGSQSLQTVTFCITFLNSEILETNCLDT